MNQPTSAETPPRDDLADIFREIVLVLGGIYAGRTPEDETVARLTRALAPVYRRALERRAGRTRPVLEAVVKPHPAIAQLLGLIGERGASAPAGTEKPKSAGVRQESMQFVRVPGVFCSCDVADLIEDGGAFYVEAAGVALDETPLFAVFRRERIQTKEI